jgi:hypothetical protein
METRVARRVVETDPCVCCGTKGGHVRERTDKPTRISAKRFGVDGTLCQACYEDNRCLDIERNWQALLTAPGVLREMSAERRAIQNEWATRGDRLEALRLARIMDERGERPRVPPSAHCARILTDWRKRFGRPGREGWESRIAARKATGEGGLCWMTPGDIVNIKSDDLMAHDERPVACVRRKGHAGTHRFRDVEGMNHEERLLDGLSDSDIPRVE